MRRRDVINSAACAAALFGVSGNARGAEPLPDDSLLTRRPEAYWKRIRQQQFLLPDWRVYLNNGSLGVAPRPVVRAVTDYVNLGAALTQDEYPRWGYETMDAHRTELAAFLGCKKDELAFMHNATEAMCTIAAGLDLKAGDEVLLTDQEHPSGRGCWYQKAKRYNITVREAKIPLPPRSSDEVADIVISAIGPRTKVLSFSGITTTTGLLMPVRRICDAARAKGLLTVVDGAHMNGQTPVSLSELGCDFYAGSPHKWLFAPPGCGILYVREEMLDRLWATTVTGNWEQKDLKAARFMMVGTNNRAVFEGLMAGLRFHKQLGSERIYGRIHSLARMAFEKARQSPHVELLTPEDDRLYAGLVAVRIKKDPAPLFALCKKKRMWVMQSQNLRLSTHIHTRPSDIDLFFETVKEAFG